RRAALRRGFAGEAHGGGAAVHGVGDVGRRGAPDERPVDALEEWVLLDLGGAAAVREALLRLLGQQAPDEVPGGGADAGRVGEAQRLADNVEERGAVAGALEGRGAVQQLVEEDAEGPPVDGAAVAVAADDLGRQVLVRADEGHGARARRLGHELQRRPRLLPAVAVAGHGQQLLLGGLGRRQLLLALGLAGGGEDARELAALDEAGGGADAAGRGADERGADGAAEREVEIGEHDVAFLPDQHVLRLEVPVHHAQHVQVLQRQQHLGRVRPGGVLGEVLVGLLLAEGVEVAAAAELHEEAEELVGLEVGVEGGEEGVVEQA
uniref:Uncharacterized protein n=1 Tax=Triticum urartu TaxID=4572 RepID=A0A8R7UP35_TRIUA